MKRKVFLGIPTHDGMVRMELLGTVLEAAQTEDIGFMAQKFSLLVRGFNDLLAFAINHKYPYFVLLHADVLPVGQNWLTQLLDIMAEKKCDVLSVIIPIKNNSGKTSTAIQKGGLTGSEAFRARALTIGDLMSMDETFGDGMDNLLVNSGLLLLDLSAPWVGKVWFGMEDGVNYENGEYKTWGISEDWLFSIRARAAGAKIMATRAVKVKHVGSHAYTNDPNDWTQK